MKRDQLVDIDEKQFIQINKTDEQNHQISQNCLVKIFDIFSTILFTLRVDTPYIDISASARFSALSDLIPFSIAAG